MGIINWILFRDTKSIVVNLPLPLVYALETVTFMQNNSRKDTDEVITKDDIIAIALAAYMRKNLWTNSVDDAATKANREAVSFRSYKDQ